MSNATKYWRMPRQRCRRFRRNIGDHAFSLVMTLFMQLPCLIYNILCFKWFVFLWLVAKILCLRPGHNNMDNVYILELHSWAKKYFPTKIFPYIFHIKPFIFKTFSWSHSLSDFHEIFSIKCRNKYSFFFI